MNIKSIFITSLLVLAASKVHAADRNLEQKVAADANGSVEISNVAGSVEIIGWDRFEVEVKGVLEEGVERVEISGGGSRTYIKVITKRNSSDGEAKLTISLPKGSEVSASTVSADINSKSVVGQQRYSTVSGDIQAQLAGADTQVKTVSGDIELHGTHRPADLRLSSVSGNLHLEGGAGEVEANSVSGDVNIEADPARNVRLHSTSGDLAFQGQLLPNAALEAETVSGEVSLKARSKSGYEYEAQSFSGEIENCFGQEPQRERYSPGSRLNGKLGEGAGRVRVKSMSGDVNLCDK